MLRNSVQILASQVRIGMFVAELDKPWEESSYPLQTILITSDDEIETLKRESRTVRIDPTHSLPGSFEHLPDLHVVPKKFEALAWLQRLRSRFGEFGVASQEVAQERQAAGLIPPNVTPTLYGPMKPIEAEIERAEEVYLSTDATFDLITRQVAGGETVDLERLGGAIENMVESAVANPDALLWVARIRAEDAATYAHGVKVAIYLLQLGRHLGFAPDMLANLGAIGLLLDLGKIKVDRELLLRQDKLTPAESMRVRLHVELGIQVLDESGDVDPAVREGIAQHHERLDGSGYPHGLTGPRISIYGRMAAIADSFAALTSLRPYALPLPAYEALKLLHGQVGTLYDGPLVEQFVQAIGVFPAGSLVELGSGEVAVVLAPSRARRLEPRVLILTDAARKAIHEPQPLDLLEEPKAADGSAARIVRGLPSGAYGLDLRQFYFR